MDLITGMARFARVVAPGFPRHITQRGNRQQPTFFGDDNYLNPVDKARAQKLKDGCDVYVPPKKAAIRSNGIHTSPLHGKTGPRASLQRKWTANIQWQ
jgi:hypothetical protein